MTPAHLTNLLVHIGTGTAALLIGFTVLLRAKGTDAHRRLGRMFSWLTLVVCLSAMLGLIAFRFLPLFAVLTLLVLYQLGGGWRAGRTREAGPALIDALWTIAAIAGSVVLVGILVRQPEGLSTIVVSTLGGLYTVVAYDVVRWLFPRRWHRIAWRYEHSYKLIAATSGMLSALMGNVVRVGRPWSQLWPVPLGYLVIFYFFYQLYREDTASLTA
jgi:uncharacterized membrane protein